MSDEFRGFLSIIQFCPDLSRRECANVGLVMVVPTLHFFKVALAGDNAGPKKRFGATTFDEARLDLAKSAIAHRLEREAVNWSRPEDLLQFASKEGNHLLLTPPRTVLVEDAEAEFADYFTRLVHFTARKNRRVKAPNLRDVFAAHLCGVPLEENVSMHVRGLGNLKFPYAYRNGVRNLVTPEGFPADSHRAIEKAKDLAVQGHLVARESGEKSKLIVVANFSSSVSEDTRGDIGYILQEHDARLVPVSTIGAYVEEVRREAHR